MGTQQQILKSIVILPCSSTEANIGIEFARQQLTTDPVEPSKVGKKYSWGVLVVCCKPSMGFG